MQSNRHNNLVAIESRSYLNGNGRQSYAASKARLRPVLLALLSKQPNTGYGLARLLRRDLNYLWDARLQQIYFELAKLHASGFLAVTTTELPGRPPKKEYSLTPDGERALNEWLSEAPVPVQPKDELLMRLYCIERVPSDRMIGWLDRYRNERRREAEELNDRRERLAHMNGSSPGPLLALDVAIKRAECDVAWCEGALATIDSDQGRYNFRSSLPDGLTG